MNRVFLTLSSDDLPKRSKQDVLVVVTSRPP